MRVSEMMEAVNGLIDDVAEGGDVITWFNMAKDDMAVEVGARFPSLTLSDATEEYAIDSRFHMALVYYAASKYKEQDSSLDEAMNFMTQYMEIKKTFVVKADIPAYYREDHNSQQFVASEGQTTFTITKSSYDPRYGDLQVYVNGQRTYVFTTMDNTITLPTITTGDMVSCIWEEHTDLVESPYNWWKW